MNQILEIGQTVFTDEMKAECKIEEYIAGGGQGEVYRANIDGKPIALKWYFPDLATDNQRKALEKIIKKGPPTDNFLWPIELATCEGIPGFGYIMPFREESPYKGLADLTNRRIVTTFRSLVTACMELSEAFHQLHAKGLCYCDISHGNVFFNPDSGSILVCDNDNVVVDGIRGDIKGTIFYMAPEIVCGKALPSQQTDLFSLAVLLFQFLLNHHPLEGKRESSINWSDDPETAMEELYGKNPLFIFDPHDHSNEPDPEYHKNALIYWPLYPTFIKDLFTKAFTVGICDPEHGRVRDTEWKLAMVQLRDSIVCCGKCNSENFYDQDISKTAGETTGTCWSCNQTIILPFRIQIGTDFVMLNRGTRLYYHHIDYDRQYDFTKPVVEVTQHPKHPDIWGIKNLSEEKWVSTTVEGTITDIVPGRNVKLARGTKINFGKVEGEIKYE